VGSTVINLASDAVQPRHFQAMSYRPQYAYPAPPPGWKFEEFEYYFDITNTPALGLNPSNRIPLPLQQDAEYRFRAVQISGNSGVVVMRFWTPDGLQLSEALIPPDDAYSGTVNGANPVGRLPVPLGDEVICPAGSQLQIDIDVLA
jgi:hypothetical protein